MAGKWEIEGKDFAMLRKAPPWGELSPVRATERGLQFLRLIVITPLRLDKLGTSPQGEALSVGLMRSGLSSVVVSIRIKLD